jgi:hypothetical protein
MPELIPNFEEGLFVYLLCFICFIYLFILLLSVTSKYANSAFPIFLPHDVKSLALPKPRGVQKYGLNDLNAYDDSVIYSSKIIPKISLLSSFEEPDKVRKENKL